MGTVAVLGTGRMGSAMARSLARAGMPLILYNRSPDRAAALAGELGARTAGSAAAAAAEADVCISMLADQSAVEATWSGPDGILAGARAGSVLVDMSTVPPEVIRSFAHAAAERGVGILDAPVSGSVPLAETGKLTIMVGGESAALERAQAVFDQLATRVVHIGPLGAGAAMKLSVNVLIFALGEALGEALVLAELSGIDRAVAYDFFTTSAAGAPFVQYKRGHFVEPDATPVGFSLALAEKDMRLILELAHRVGAPMPQTRVNLDIVRAASARLGAERDAAAVAEELRAMAGEGVAS